MLLRSKFKWIRLLLFLVIFFICYLIADHFRLFNYLSFHELMYNAEILFAIKEQYAFTVLMIFIMIYSLSVIFCLPGSAIIKIIAGYLFGATFGSIISVLTYTTSSLLVVTIIRWIFASSLQRHFSETIIMVKQKTDFDTLPNLIGLRMMPVIPFWLYNITMSITGVSRKKFALATLIATTPISIILAIIGDSLHQVNIINEKNFGALISSPGFILPLCALSLLFLLPNLFRYIKKNKLKAKEP